MKTTSRKIIANCLFLFIFLYPTYVSEAAVTEAYNTRNIGESSLVCADTTISVESCFSYLSPAGNLLTESGTYVDTLDNGNGCDSVVTINLTINTVNVEVDRSACGGIASLADNAEYQWLSCDDDMSIVAGATGQNYLPVVQGSYAVEVTQNNCIDTSACIYHLLNGINTNLLSEKLHIYPNPVRDHVIIEFEELQTDLLLIIRNLNGQQIVSENFGISDNIIYELEGTPGIYLFEIHSSEIGVVRRLVRKE